MDSQLGQYHDNTGTKVLETQLSDVDNDKKYVNVVGFDVVYEYLSDHELDN